MTLWEVDIHPAAGQPDLPAAARRGGGARTGAWPAICTSRRPAAFWCRARFDRAQVERLARELLADLVVETPVLAKVGDAALVAAAERRLDRRIERRTLRHRAAQAGRDGPGRRRARSRRSPISASRPTRSSTLRKYWFAGWTTRQLKRLAAKAAGQRRDRAGRRRPADARAPRRRLGRISSSCVTCRSASWTTTQLRAAQPRGAALACTLAEMQTIQQHFRELGREPTDVELETIAQTWSEHCSHKTLAGRVAYRDENGERQFENLLKETIFAATQEIRQRAGRRTTGASACSRTTPASCEFDDAVSTSASRSRRTTTRRHRAVRRGEHGHRRRDPRPARHRPRGEAVCNTDVFCFAPPDTPAGRAAAGRAAPAAGDAGRRRRRARLRQPHGHSRRSTARSTSTSATSAIRSSSAATSG